MKPTSRWAGDRNVCGDDVDKDVKVHSRSARQSGEVARTNANHSLGSESIWVRSLSPDLGCFTTCCTKCSHNKRISYLYSNWLLNDWQTSLRVTVLTLWWMRSYQKEGRWNVTVSNCFHDASSDHGGPDLVVVNLDTQPPESHKDAASNATVQQPLVINFQSNRQLQRPQRTIHSPGEITKRCIFRFNARAGSLFYIVLTPKTFHTISTGVDTAVSPPLTILTRVRGMWIT